MKKFLRYPIVRIILGIVVCMGILIISQQLFPLIPGVSSLGKDVRNLLKGLLVSVLLLSSYTLFYKKIEDRPITELSFRGMGKNLFWGVFTGFVLQSLTILVIYLYGGYKIIAVNPVSSLVIPFTLAFTVAIIEEILLRGIVFRITEEKLGSVIAFIISGIIFGALHLFNPHVTVIAAITIIIVGVLLSAAYMYYRSLWFPIAIHFTWNFMQNGIYGAITSGTEKTSSLFTAKIEGAEMITGGQFGPEGAIQALLFCAIATILMITLLKKQNKLIKPYWKSQP